MAESEDITSLCDKLAQAVDDNERAGLRDAIAIQLARAGRYEEALAECTLAVQLRERVTEGDAANLLPLASSLTRLGQILVQLGRHDEAISAHTRALEILPQFDSDEGVWSLSVYNSSCLGALLAERQEWHWAAKFDGLALGLSLGLEQHYGEHRGEVSERLNAICRSLDRARAFTPRPTGSRVDSTRLEALARPAYNAASYLDSWSGLQFDGGDFRLAGALAGRIICYCDLFSKSEPGELWESLRSNNQRRLALCVERDEAAGKTQRSRTQDRRLWSCTGEQFALMLDELIERGFPPSDVHTLGRRLRASGTYPARDLEYRCQSSPPEVFITYTWSENYVDLSIAIRSVLNYLSRLIREARPDVDDDRVVDLVYRRLGIWVDFVFIDQASRNVTQEVREVVPRALAGADLHFVLSDHALLRSWCCYELALFHQHSATTAAEHEGLRSFVGRSRGTRYETFAQTATSTPSDKAVIEFAITSQHPGGMHGFDALMIQAAMLSDEFVSNNFVQSAAALELVARALDKWLTSVAMP